MQLNTACEPEDTRSETRMTTTMDADYKPKYRINRDLMNFDHVERIVRAQPKRNNYSETRWQRVEQNARVTRYVIKQTERRRGDRR